MTTALLRAGFDPSQPRDPGGEDGGQWVKGGSGGPIVAAGAIGSLPERTAAQREEDRTHWRRGIAPSSDGFYHVYHGTIRDRAEAILRDGLNKPGDVGLTITTSPGQALKYAQAFEGEPVVVHIALTPEEATNYLHRPEEHDVYGFQANAQALKKTIPARVLNRRLGMDANNSRTETAERPFLVRSFEVAAVEVEGRTVDVRLVPFGEVARVSDDGRTEYDEEWMPGCFDHQLSAANRIHANYEHERGVQNIVGHGVSLRAEPDGYHITSTIHRTAAGDTTLELINGGALPCVSLEARPVRNVRSTAGVVQRVKANLRGFAFCRQGAFRGAQVLAVRTDDELEPEQTLDAALLPVSLDPKLVERCRRLGIKLPARYEAHPAEGTPDTSGTPSETAPAEPSQDDISEE